MRRTYVGLAAGMVLCGGLVGCASEQVSPRQRVSLDGNWRFQKDEAVTPQGDGDTLAYRDVKQWVLPTGNAFVKDGQKAERPAGNLGADVAYTQAGYDDSGWRKLDLPHDWGVEGPFKQEYPGETGKLPWWGVAWYRHHLKVPAGEQGKRFYLDLDGAMAYSMVWVNGQFAGGWPYGYQPYELDITRYVKAGGDNVVVVRVDNPQDSSRWYPGGGIYRNVWLTTTSPVHVGHWGTYVSTPEASAEAATVKAKITVRNDSAAGAKVAVKTAIFAADKEGKKTGSAVASLRTDGVEVGAGQEGTAEQSIRLANPRLWDIGAPKLYVAETTVEQDGKVVDSYDTTFGVRTIKFDADKGFLINGRHVRLQGVCDHHDLGALGSALNTRALQRQIEILQEMGCNAIRTSHNPPAPELLDLCDRMGVVVMDESFDCWAMGKKKNDYHLLFPDWHERDWRAELRRDRNHPSILLWSIGNEIREQWSKDGQKVAEELTRIAHEEDPTRPTTAACNNNQAGFNGFQNTVDVFGYNYKWADYARFHQAHPEKPLIGTETASTVSSRGEYFFPVVDNKDGGKADFQMSSYDLYAPRWAWPPDDEFKSEDENPNVGGEFVWTGFDYLGEPTPYNGDTTNLLNFTDAKEQAKAAAELKELGKLKVPSRSSYFGIIDLAGFKKDRFYLYQAHWRPELRMVHLLPHWNWPDRVGQVTPVFVYTTGDEAELFLNGKSLGRKKKEPLQYRIRWNEVKYEPGELKVVAYKEGKKWAEDEVKTTGPAEQVKLEADRSTLKADGQDLSFVTVRIADKDALTVPTAKNHVTFEVTGPAEIAAVDNGDATSFEPFQAKERNAFNGLALVIVRTKAGEHGTITLTAHAEGLKDGRVTMESEGGK